MSSVFYLNTFMVSKCKVYIYAECWFGKWGSRQFLYKHHHNLKISRTHLLNSQQNSTWSASQTAWRPKVQQLSSLQLKHVLWGGGWEWEVWTSPFPHPTGTEIRLSRFCLVDPNYQHLRGVQERTCFATSDPSATKSAEAMGNRMKTRASLSCRHQWLKN